MENQKSWTQQSDKENLSHFFHLFRTCSSAYIVDIIANQVWKRKSYIWPLNLIIFFLYFFCAISFQYNEMPKWSNPRIRTKSAHPQLRHNL